MRDLDRANAALQSTKHVFTISLLIPLVMGFGAWALATGAAPGLPLRANYLEMFALALIGISILSLPLPYIFNWNWETKYFGAGLLLFGTGSIMGIYPILCMVLYGTSPLVLRIPLIIFEGMLIAWWCNRFIKVYRSIYDEKSLFNQIYAEEDKEVYFLQQADKKILENHFRFRQIPADILLVAPMIVSLAMTPFASPISAFFGVPFAHVFLAIGASPLNLLFLGMSTKAWLIFYYYPYKIKRSTNKRVYMDKTSQPL